jgi:hypothetical protein
VGKGGGEAASVHRERSSKFKVQEYIMIIFGGLYTFLLGVFQSKKRKKSLQRPWRELSLFRMGK